MRSIFSGSLKYKSFRDSVRAEGGLSEKFQRCCLRSVGSVSGGVGHLGFKYSDIQNPEPQPTSKNDYLTIAISLSEGAGFQDPWKNGQ